MTETDPKTGQEHPDQPEKYIPVQDPEKNEEEEQSALAKAFQDLKDKDSSVQETDTPQSGPEMG